MLEKHGHVGTWASVMVIWEINRIRRLAVSVGQQVGGLTIQPDILVHDRMIMKFRKQ